VPVAGSKLGPYRATRGTGTWTIGLEMSDLFFEYKKLKKIFGPQEVTEDWIILLN
jgi:hypothetical protein